MFERRMSVPAPHRLGARVACALGLLALLAVPGGKLWAQLADGGTISAAPTSVKADGTTTSTITVTATLLGVPTGTGGDTVVLNTTLGTLSAVTDVGNGTYTATITSTASGVATISGTVNGNNITGNAQVTFTATQLVFQVQPSNTQAGSTITPGVKVAAVGADGTTVDTSFTGNITIAIGTNPAGGTLAPPGNLTRPAAAGVLTYGNLSIDNAGNGYTLTVSATGLTGATSNAFNITAPPTATELRFGTVPATATSGSAFTVTVRATDSGGTTITTFSGTATITIANDPSGGATLGGTTSGVAFVNGVATFSTLTINRAGNGFTLQATSSPALTAATSSAFNITANHLVFGVQPTNTQAGNSITPAVTVQALDAANQVAMNFTGNVTASISTNPGGGTLSGTTTVGASAGVATFSNLSINKSGTGYRLGATASGLTATPASNTFNITPAAANHLVYGQVPTNTPAGASITPAVTVRALDQFDNLDSNFAGAGHTVTIAIQNNAGPGGILTGTTNQTPVAGVATFNDLKIDKTGNGYTLIAASSGVSSVVSPAFNITVGAATHLVFGQQPPSSTPAGQTMSPAITVRALDSGDQLDTNFNGTVAIAIGTNPPGNGTLSGTKMVAAVNGVATFSNLSIDKAGNGYTLTANSPGKTGATSNPFNITAGAATGIQFLQQPSNTQAGASITPAVTVRAVDASNNTATNFNGNVTISLGTNPSGGTLSGTLTVAASNGVATFGNLSIDKTGNGYALRATASVGSPVNSNAFNVTPGTPATGTSTVDASPGTITANGTNTSTITVRLKDAFGNNLTSSGGTVTLSLSSPPPGGSLGSVTDNGNGTYTATLTSSTTAGTVTVSARINGNLISDTAQVTYVAGGAAVLRFQQQPSTTEAGSAISPPVTVRAVDSNNNTVTGFNGQVTINNLRLNKAGSGYTLAAEGGGLAGDVSQAFQVVPGPGVGANSRIEADPHSIPADGSSTAAVTVFLKDAFGNELTSGGDNVVLQTTLGSLSPVVDNGDGTYSTTLRSSTVPGTATVTGTVNGASIASSTAVVFTSASTTDQLEFQVQPTAVAVGAAISPAVVVRVTDGQGGVVTDFSDPITIALGANPGGATLSGTVTVTPVNGIVTFSNLRLDKPGNGYRLVATASGASPATSAAFQVLPGPPSAATTTITASPTSIVADGASTSTITVQLKDAAGNDLTTGGATVALNTTAGTLSAVTDLGNGTYRATLTSSTTPTTATVRGTLNGTQIAASATVTFTSGGGGGGGGENADLAVSMTVDKARPKAGETVVFTVRVVNNGPDAATGVRVTDQLPPRLMFVSSSASQGSYASSTGIWTVGSLDVGQSATLAITATVNSTTGASP